MPGLPSNSLSQLLGIGINPRDRRVLYIYMGGCTALAVALSIAAIALGYYGRPTRDVVALADTLYWIDFGLVVVFVGGTVEHRRVIAKTMTPPTIEAQVDATIKTEGARRSEA